MIKAIKGEASWSISSFVKDILDPWGLFRSIKFNFIPREFNRTVHLLAKYDFDRDDCFKWSDKQPVGC